MAEQRVHQEVDEFLVSTGAEVRVEQEVTERLAQSLTEIQVHQDVTEFLYDDTPGPPPPPAPGEFHARKGRSFEIDVAFMVPPEERLFDAPTIGFGAPATPDPDFSPTHGYDEALDECFCIVQKGGDRTAPMSWALAVVNIGQGFATDAPDERPSNYGLAWIWFDAPGWGSNVPATMMYNLTNGEFPTTGANAQYSTQAFRAILIHKFIEPGKRYHVAVQVSPDSGSPGSGSEITSWNEDGFFKVWVKEENEAPELFSAAKPASGLVVQGMEVYKGPDDSIDYLTKYGIRYSSRDAIFVGLGFRSHVWKKASFIPWGADAAPLEHGGYRVIDRSRHTIDEIYGVGIYTLTAEKAALADPYVTINHRGFAASNTHGGTAPMGFWGGAAYLEWAGLNSAAAGGAPYNPEALRHYRLVTTADFVDGAPVAKGMILDILSYDETAIGGRFPVTIAGGDAIEAFAESPVLVQAFRWRQRDVVIGDVRIWAEPRAYDDFDAVLASRRKLSLGRTVRLDDQTEPDIENLIAYWPMDDAGGATMRELVAGRSGFLAPLGLGSSDGGER
jgi:hypothetical protein